MQEPSWQIRPANRERTASELRANSRVVLSEGFRGQGRRDPGRKRGFGQRARDWDVWTSSVVISKYALVPIHTAPSGSTPRYRGNHMLKILRSCSFNDSPLASSFHLGSASQCQSIIQHISKADMHDLSKQTFKGSRNRRRNGAIRCFV